MRAADPPLGCGWPLGAPGQGQCFLDDGMRALHDWDGVSVWFCPLLRAGGLPRGKALGASKISTRALGKWPPFPAFYPLPPQPVDSSGVLWMSVPNPPAHFKFCKEFPCLFPLLKEQGYQRGLVRGGSVCPESNFVISKHSHFSIYQPGGTAWADVRVPSGAPGSVWVDPAAIALTFLQFWFYLVQPHRVSKGKTRADPSPSLIFSSPSFRIMHDEVSETENIRKNLAIERMIIEGCEILLDTSQTFVRQGLCQCQCPFPLQ